MKTDTIFALSSAKGKAGVALFRISGPKALEVISFLGVDIAKLKPRFLSLAKIFDPYSEEEIDDAMVVYFKAPASFTGEDIIEIHTHGSVAISNRLTETILKYEGVRYAQAGEFTKRAILNGKMDLTRAEGLIDLINAETTRQHKQALFQMRGGLYEQCDSWRKEIISIMSLLEAFIDFPEEEIPEEVLNDAEHKISNLINIFKNLLADKRQGERLTNGLRLAIYGKPNVGKTSLLNYLCQREVAIVSSIAGTTRDVIETHIDINGYPIILSDTAGIHEETEDLIEIEGIKRAKIAIENADIKIYMQESGEAVSVHEKDLDTIYVINKIDLCQPELDENYLKISIKENKGLDSLLNKIAEKAEELAGTGDDSVITRKRHRVAINRAHEALQQVNLRGDIVLAAEDLRLAARELAMLIGIIDVEDILTEVFSTFCIGK